MSTKQTIGSAVFVDFPISDITNVPARVDTGAARSSIWANITSEDDGKLCFTLFDPIYPHHTGMVICAENYRKLKIVSSMGHKEPRYAVDLDVVIAGKPLRASFTLANREGRTYPILIGRELLEKHFIVDVSLPTTIKPEGTI